VFFNAEVFGEKTACQERPKSVSLYTPFSRCSTHNNHYTIKINWDVITTYL